MTPQEQQMIDGLVDRIRNTSVTDKDLDADRYLKQALASSPDAIYLLAQTVLVQQYGLQQAQSQIASLQDQLRSQPTQPSGGGSFLSHLFGGSGSQSATPPQTQTPPYQPVNNPGNPPNATPGWAAYGGQSATPPAYAQPMMYPPPPTGYAPAGGGFLRNALQTAAGVAAGEVAFAGMESLFHGFGGSGGYSGGGFGGGGYEGGRPEEIVNNYYDDGDRGEHRETRGDSDYSRDDSNMGIDPNAPDEGFDNNDTSSGDTGFDSSSDDSNSY
jgi:hypothetical protein